MASYTKAVLDHFKDRMADINSAKLREHSARFAAIAKMAAVDRLECIKAGKYRIDFDQLGGGYRQTDLLFVTEHDDYRKRHNTALKVAYDRLAVELRRASDAAYDRATFRGTAYDLAAELQAHQNFVSRIDLAMYAPAMTEKPAPKPAPKRAPARKKQ